MAKAAVRLTEEENIVFHKNYAYMWKKLNTVPYYVSGAGEAPPWIQEPWLLPSYANLSKCQQIDYVPSVNLVNKIVQFYNANIHPEIDTFTFLHDTLETGDNMRAASTVVDSEPFCGVYRGYYYAGLANKKEVYGAIIRIQKAYGELVVQMITGITDDRDFDNPKLRELMADKKISSEKYNEFRDSLPISKRRTTLYKGTVQLSTSFMSLQMSSEDRASSLLVMQMPLADFIDNRYFGSIGMLNLFSERTLQILKIGVVRADESSFKPFSLKSQEIENVLMVDKLQNEHIQIEFNDNALWSDMVMSEIQ